MKNEIPDAAGPRYLRVLEHGVDDQIRIGFSFFAANVHKAAVDTARQYDEKLLWVGGFSADAARKYYRGIRLVDAETLGTVADVFDGKDWVVGE